MRRVIGVALLAAASVLAQDEIVDLTGWRAQEGDDVRWALPDFDDAGWNVAAPLSAGSRVIGTFGWAPVTWYRVTYRIPPQWRGNSLTLGIWKLDDAYEVAENSVGELFGFERTRAISGQSAGEIAAVATAWGQNDDITVVTARRMI